MGRWKDIFKIIGQSVAWTLLAVLTLGLYGMALAIHRDTIINGAIVSAAAGVLAVLTAVAVANILAARGERDSRMWIKVFGMMVFFNGLYLFSFYALNYHCADKETLVVEKVSVVRKYHEVHHHSQRNGRRSYSAGRPYNVYFMQISFPDGQTKDMRISMKRYMKIHPGDTIDMQLETGLFGFPVILSNSY